MNAIIISIGDELTSGQTIDSNSAYLARELAAVGIATVQHITIGDDRAAIARAITEAAASASIVIVTGGLGPTEDDLTRQALADAMGVELQCDAAVLAEIEAFFKARSRPMAPSNRIQAMVPRGAQVLTNKVGTACGLAAQIASASVFIMPGVPFEMQWMYTNHIAPRLPQGQGAIIPRVVHTFGQGESDVGARIADLMARGANPTVGTTVAAGMVSIRVVARAPSRQDADRMVQQTIDEINRRLGPLVIGEGDDTMPVVLGRLLLRHAKTLATAESCTGGMIGEMITSIPGSSAYYFGGVVPYADAAKAELLGVPVDLIRRDGAVSESVARAMALGCLDRFGSDYALSVTGIAGPGGATPQKPVGLVYIALAAKGSTVDVFKNIFPGTREIVRLRASLAAMNHLRLALQG